MVVGLVGLAAHETYRPARGPSASDVGVVSSRAASASTSSAERTTPGGLVATHSTELGAQGGNGTDAASVAIPRLRVRAATTAAGIGPDNRSLDLLPSARAVMWWAYGAYPGAAAGTVLLAGHVSWDGRVGVLAGVGRLRLGDVVTLTRRDGTAFRYAVTGRTSVRKMSLSRLGVFAIGGAPRLVLVTCGGRYDAARHSYDDNVVVQARPI